MPIFLNRIIRAARLDPQLYEEVEADRSALGQAFAVVVLSSIASGIGSVYKAPSFHGIAAGLAAALIGWFIWAVVIYLIGVKLLPEPQTSSNTGELLRTIGFASSPGLIRIFGVIPALTDIVFAIASAWILVAMIVAIRQALDYKSTLRAVIVALIGWVLQVVVGGFIFFVVRA